MRRAPFGAVQWNTRTLASFLVSKPRFSVRALAKNRYLAEGRLQNSI